MRRFSSLFALVFAALVASSSAAQPPVTATVVAARVQRFYDQTSSVEASFYQTHYTRVYDRYQRGSGRLLVEKPGRIRFDYAAPNRKVIVSDGRELTMYEPGDEGGPGQYVRRPATEAALSRAFGFLLGDTRLDEDHRLTLLDSRPFHFAGHVLELRPKRATPEYVRILLFVESDPTRAGVVRTIRIDDADGNRNKIELRSIHFNRDIDDSSFAFTPPRGSRAMD